MLSSAEANFLLRITACPHVPACGTQVTCKQLVGVYLSLWARRRVAKHIRSVQATCCATGFGGYLGNKGAPPNTLQPQAD
jgi:hypothetical protein